MNIFCVCPAQKNPEQKSSDFHPPALVVLQEAFGVNAHIQNVCRKFANEGYAVFSPELYHRSGEKVIFGYDEYSKLKALLANLTNEMLLEDVKATINFIDQKNLQPTPVFVVGFCMGSFTAMLAACHLPIQGCISFYGGGMIRARPGIGFSPIIQDFEKISCPVLLHFGGEDQSIPTEDIRLIRQKLVDLGKDYELSYYPHAGHGFFCEERPVYNQEAAQKAWGETLKWLKKH